MRLLYNLTVTVKEILSVMCLTPKTKTDKNEKVAKQEKRASKFSIFLYIFISDYYINKERPVQSDVHAELKRLKRRGD